MIRLAPALLLLLPALLQEGGLKGVSPARFASLPTELSRFDLPPAPFEWTLREVRSTAKVAFHELSFPSAAESAVVENRTAWAKVWFPVGEKKRRPAVLLLHYLRGSFLPMESAGVQFAQEGLVAMLLYLPHYGRRQAAAPEKRLRFLSADVPATVANVVQAVQDARRAGDWLASRPEVDPTRIGVFGVSLGAVVGSIVAGVEPRFTRHVLVAGGGDLASIVLNGGPELTEVAAALKEGGWTPEKLAAALRPVEPLSLAPRVDGPEVRLFNATKDQIIPRAATERLWEAMGRPPITWLESDHYGVALHFPRIVKDAVGHFSRPLRY